MREFSNFDEASVLGNVRVSILWNPDPEGVHAFCVITPTLPGATKGAKYRLRANTFGSGIARREWVEDTQSFFGACALWEEWAVRTVDAAVV